MTDNDNSDTPQDTRAIHIGNGATGWWVVIDPPIPSRWEWFFPYQREAQTFAEGMAAGTGWSLRDQSSDFRHDDAEPGLFDFWDDDGSDGDAPPAAS